MGNASNKKKLNIAIITPNFPKFKGDGSGTAGLFVESFAETLAKKGHNIYIFTHKLKGSKCYDTGFGPVEVFRFGWAGSSEDIKLSALSIKSPKTIFLYYNLLKKGKHELVRFIKDNKIDHCICMWAVPSGYYARYAKKKLGTPYSIWALGADIWTYPKYPILREVIKGVIKDADFAFADGIRLSKDVKKLSGKNCDFLPSSRSLKDSKAPRLVLEKDKKHFLFIGRYERAKGPDVLIDAISLLRDHKKFYFHFFGGGSMEEQLIKKIRSKKIRNISLNGFISKEKCKAYLSKVDCLVIPSRIDSIPVILSDAMQMSCPVIVTDVGDTGRLVRKYGSGIVVPPERPDIMAEAIISISRMKRADFKKQTSELFSIFDINRVASEYIMKINRSIHKY